MDFYSSTYVRSYLDQLALASSEGGKAAEWFNQIHVLINYLKKEWSEGLPYNR